MESSSDMPSVHIDVVSDVVCPWCYIGKRKLEEAIALTSGVNIGINWRPYFLNPWIPREGIDRHTYLETKFGSVERYAAIAERIASAAALEGLVYSPTRSAASQTRSTAIVSFCGRAASPIPAWSSSG
jgi:predicted DsbA family dithiol-disulfide isomerase